MIENELNILQNIVNDHANAVQRAEFNTAAAALHDSGSRAIQAIQHHYADVVQQNDDLERRLQETADKLAHVRAQPQPESRGD